MPPSAAATVIAIRRTFELETLTFFAQKWDVRSHSPAKRNKRCLVTVVREKRRLVSGLETHERECRFSIAETWFSEGIAYHPATGGGLMGRFAWANSGVLCRFLARLRDETGSNVNWKLTMCNRSTVLVKLDDSLGTLCFLIATYFMSSFCNVISSSDDCIAKGNNCLC